jgi:leucyl-tRNA synthetase/8-oxo-dGTP pyrophosphatase MutT (NUDIX family)/predicted alpha/beta hydrolase family esterase/ASC-1-like (ASCH) protein
MKKYDPQAIEPKWQKIWADTKLYSATDHDPTREKYYYLVEFPYPSGEGLHVGHVLSYTALDIMARHKRMQGYNVLYPMGWDAFGLPTENYAIKTKQSPQAVTKQNTDRFRSQLQSLGLSFDWDREVNTSDPNYYKWTQWIFLKLFEKGLAYQDELAINWCPFEKTGLANEEVVDGKHERCGTPVEKKLLKQWLLKITAYADRLAEDLKSVDYLDRIATQQVNWIGRSEGAEITWKLEGLKSESALKRVVLMHGKNETPAGKWYPWFGERVKAAGLDYIAPELGVEDVPKLADWTVKLEDTKPDESTILIGHSRGGMAILRWLEQAPAAVKVGRVVLVAANDGAQPDKAGGDFFYGKDYDFAKIKSHCSDFVVVHSRDDKWVPFEAGEKIAAGLGVELSAFDGKNHFGKDTPQVPEIAALALQGIQPSVTVYTTRPDTLFGATFLVVSPEVADTWLKSGWGASKTVRDYIDTALKASELSRQEESKTKTGVDTGLKAIHPLSGEPVPVWVADYVLGSYGTGAIMAVPAHDERDYEFAKAMNGRVTTPSTKPETFVDKVTAPRAGEPFEDRQAALAIVKHPTEDKYLVLKLLSWNTPVHSFPMGGIDPNETPTESALRELTEETGYDHIANAAALNQPYIAEFYHEHKQVNRRAYVEPVLIQLADLHQRPIKAEERELHEPIWVTGPEALKLIHGEGAKKTFRTYLERDKVREFGTPHPEAKPVEGSVVIGYDPRTKKYLSIKHTETWMVGGNRQDDETFEQTARRELAEETGYQAEALIQLGGPVQSHYYNDIKKSHRRSHAYNFLAILDSSKPGSPVPEAHEKFAVEWLTYDELVAAVKKTGGGVDHWLHALNLARQAVQSHAHGESFTGPLRITPVVEPVTVDGNPGPDVQPEERHSIVVILRNPKTNELLTLDWGDKGGVLFIGGGVEDGEAPQEAAAREILEETGYKNVRYVQHLDWQQHHTYYTHAKKRWRTAHTTGVLFDLLDDEQGGPGLEEYEKGFFEPKWQPADKIDSLVHDLNHRQMYHSLIKGEVFTGEGPLINSGQFNGLEGIEAKRAIVKALFDKGAGKASTKYRLRDWIFSRQHYWGEPIPIIHCEACKKRAETESLELSFYDVSSWDRLVAGTKTVETRAADEDRQSIKAGATLRAVNRRTNEVAYFKVKEAKHFKTLKDFLADTSALEGTYGGSGRTATAVEELEKDYAYTPDYVARIHKNGLMAWDVERVIPGTIPVPEDQLPVELPIVEHYETTETGESPLAAISDWVNTTCPQCGGPAKRETDTMPNWAGSSWYFLRYTDPHNAKEFASPEHLKYWTPVDLYNGGMEHTTLHLLYSRFWHKFLYDEGLVPTSEPYARRRSHGMILGPDGQKMSKSRGNVINPDHVVERYGADTIRLYEMFMGPFDEVKAWSEDHLNGVSRFLYRVWTWLSDMADDAVILPESVGYQQDIGAFTAEVDRTVHKTLKKAHEDIEGMHFNTAVSAMMELINFLTSARAKQLLHQANAENLRHRTVRTLILMLAPFTPHLSEEAWHGLGEEGSVHAAGWPKYDPELIKDDVITAIVQINGKLRANLAAPVEASEAELTDLAKADPNVARHLEGKTIVKTVVVPRKLVNFVVK